MGAKKEGKVCSRFSLPAAQIELRKAQKFRALSPTPGFWIRICICSGCPKDSCAFKADRRCSRAAVLKFRNTGITWGGGAVNYEIASQLSRVRLFVTPWTVARQASLSVEFSRQESGVGNHSRESSPGDLPHPGIKSRSTWQNFLPSEPPGEPLKKIRELDATWALPLAIGQWSGHLGFLKFLSNS